LAGENILGARVLIKAFGKCTTDHISMAGPWLRFRGHLDNISNNMLIGAINAFNQKQILLKSTYRHLRCGSCCCAPIKRLEFLLLLLAITITVKDLLENMPPWNLVLGVKAVLVKSFARIHETNLKKQGLLGLTFATESDYDKIQEDDTINFIDLVDFAPGKPLTLEFVHTDGTTDSILANHTYNEGQIGWFVAGSALNLIAAAGNA
jgi:aconitate hydratase